MYFKKFFFSESNDFIWQECIKLIDIDGKDMYNVTKGICNTLLKGAILN